jgi:hypothetical protein
MRRCLSTAGLMLAVLLVVSGRAPAADAPYVGTWKVVVESSTQEISLFLLKIEEKAGGPKIELVSVGLPAYKDAKIEAAKPDGDALRFTSDSGRVLKFAFYPTKGDPKKMLGSVEIGTSRDFARLEKTEDTEIDPKNAFKNAEGAQEFVKAAFQTQDPNEKETALKAILEKHADDVMGFQCQVALLQVLPVNGAKDEDVKATADKAIKFASVYGPETKNFAIAQIAQRLVASKKAPTLALEYARLAEKALPKDATTAQQVATLKTLQSALKQAEKTDDLKTVTERLAKLDKILDDEFLKTAVPFKTEAFTREGKGSRVALVELFTGAQCPPCVAADVAFDAALKTYQPKDVILVQYHMHIPGPDALTNDDTESRWKYYAGRGVPSTYLNGSANLPLGGSKEMAKGAFDKLSEAVKKQLDSDANGTLKLTAKQSGSDSDNLLINVEVEDLKDAGEDTKLRLVLLEEMVRYPGNNGQRFHHHVVRMMPGGVDGFELKEPKVKQEVKVNLSDLRKKLADYLEEANKRRPFLNDDRPLDLKHLKVVAFIQNDKTKEILQAVQVDVAAK